MNKKIIGAIIGAIAIIAVFVGINGTKANNKEKNIIVQTKQLKKEDIVEVLSTTGTLMPNNSQYLIGQELVTDVKVKLGDKVKKDQVLAIYASGQELKAAFDGVVTALNIKKDEMDYNASMNQPSIQIDDLSKLKISAGLSKSEATKIKKDQTVTILNGKDQYKGKVAFIDPIAKTSQSATGTSTSLPVEISFDETPNNLFAGFDVDLDIQTAKVEQALALPIEALQYDKENNPYVFRVVDGKAKKTAIEVGIQSDTMVEIKNGLKEEETVILSPDTTIKNDTAVSTKAESSTKNS